MDSSINWKHMVYAKVLPEVTHSYDCCLSIWKQIVESNWKYAFWQKYPTNIINEHCSLLDHVACSLVHCSHTQTPFVASIIKFRKKLGTRYSQWKGQFWKVWCTKYSMDKHLLNVKLCSLAFVWSSMLRLYY